MSSNNLQPPSILCEQTQEAILALLDDEFVPEQQAILAKHLPQCAECQAYQASMEHLTLSLRKIEDVPVPEGLELRIMNRINAKDDTEGSNATSLAGKSSATGPMFGRKTGWPSLAPIAAAVMTLALALPLIYQAINPGASFFEAPGSQPSTRPGIAATSAAGHQGDSSAIQPSAMNSSINSTLNASDLASLASPSEGGNGNRVAGPEAATQPTTPNEIASALPGTMTNVENAYASSKEGDIYFDPLSSVVDF